MQELVRKTLEIYLREKRIIVLSEIPASVSQFSKTKDAVFVTLYFQGSVIASSGRIQCRKDTTVFECIDNTLLCLKDPRFTSALQTPEQLEEIHIRVDILSTVNRRILQKKEDFDIKNEGLIFLSQNHSIMSVLLPGMCNIASTPDECFQIVAKKARLEPDSLTNSDYVLYAIKTERSSDF